MRQFPSQLQSKLSCVLEGWRSPSSVSNTPVSPETTADTGLHGLGSETFCPCKVAYPEDISRQTTKFLGKNMWKKTDCSKEGRKEGRSTVPFPHPVHLTPLPLLPQFILCSSTLKIFTTHLVCTEDRQSSAETGWSWDYVTAA